jgi:hypothetical protein
MYLPGRFNEELPDVLAFAGAGKPAFGKMDHHDLAHALLEKRARGVTQTTVSSVPSRLANLESRRLTRLDLIKDAVIHVL